MAFNINELKSQLNKNNGVARTSHFLVQITGAKFIRGSADVTSSIPFFCEGTVLPGVGFQTTEVRPYGYGLIEKRPYQVVYRDLPLGFLIDGRAKMLEFFHRWKQNISNVDTSDPKKAYKSMKMFDFNYPENYEVTIEIFHFDQAGNQIIKYNLERAYPVEIADVPVAWATDEVARLGVTIAYRNWSSEKMERGTEQVADSLRYRIPRLDSYAAAAVAGTLLYPQSIASTLNTVLNQQIYVPLLNSLQ